MPHHSPCHFWQHALRSLSLLSLMLVLPVAHADTPALSLHQALVRTLEHNPRLAQYSMQQRMSDGEILQAGLTPNPELKAELENALGTGAVSGLDSAVFSLTLSQVIELGGKRAERSGLALAQSGLQQADYAMTRLDTLAETARRYIEVVAARRMLDLARRELTLATETHKAVQQRVEAGSLSVVETSQARIHVSRSQLALEHAEHELASARMHLAAAWGSTDADFEIVPTALFEVPELASFDQISQHLDDAPRMRRYLALDRVRASQLRLATANARQDIRIGAGVRRLEDLNDTALLFEVSVPLRWNDRNQGHIQTAQARHDMTRLEQRDQRVRLHAMLFEVYQETVHARTEVQILRNEVLPEINRALDQVHRGFREGRFSWTERARLAKERLEIEQQAVRSAARFHTLVLELEQLTGQSLIADAFGLEEMLNNDS